MLYSIVIPWSVHFSAYWLTCAYLMRNYAGFLAEKTVVQNLKNTTLNFWFFAYFWNVFFPVNIEDNFMINSYDFFKLPFILLIYEILFFYIHRAFHSKFLHSFHAQHHEWDAELIPLATLDANKYEYWFLNLFPAFFTFYVLRVSYCASLLFSSIAIINAAKAHGFSATHRAHHTEKCRNYGVFGIMDAYYGTSHDV